MHWHYGIVHYKAGGFGLHEVYHETDDHKGTSWTVDPIYFSVDEEEGPDAVVQALRLALDDAERHPVVEERVVLEETLEEWVL